MQLAASNSPKSGVILLLLLSFFFHWIVYVRAYVCNVLGKSTFSVHKWTYKA